MTNSTNKLIKLLNIANRISEVSAYEDGTLVYTARTLVQITLPHSNPGPVTAWGRENGKISLTIEPGYIIKNNSPVSLGIPYGSIPRLLLFWLTTEARKTNEKELVLGSSLAKFMRALGLNEQNGGIRSDATRLKEQMKRLFSSRIAVSHSDEDHLERAQYNIAAASRLLWDQKNYEDDSLFQSSVILSQEFFDEIIDRPVPVDKRVLSILKQSPLALDLYAWLTYRVSYLTKRQLVTWPQIHAQFGSDFTNIRAFRAKVRSYLGRIYTVYPELNIEDTGGGLVLMPSRTHIPKE